MFKITSAKKHQLTTSYVCSDIDNIIVNLEHHPCYTKDDIGRVGGCDQYCNKDGAKAACWCSSNRELGDDGKSCFKLCASAAWKDYFGNTCDDYINKALCDSSGEIGTGWSDGFHSAVPRNFRAVGKDGFYGTDCEVCGCIAGETFRSR